MLVQQKQFRSVDWQRALIPNVQYSFWVGDAEADLASVRVAVEHAQDASPRE
jgi:hypothetical protein